MSRVECLPRGIFSWNFDIRGGDGPISVESQWWSEQGRITLGGTGYDVTKHGMTSGRWTVEKADGILYSAQKTSAFHRTFEIRGGTGLTSLRALSAFSRVMSARGPGADFTVKPVHAFTRRSTIEGAWPDELLMAFAFWLTVITWRRAAGGNGGGSAT